MFVRRYDVSLNCHRTGEITHGIDDQAPVVDGFARTSAGAFFVEFRGEDPSTTITHQLIPISAIRTRFIDIWNKAAT